MKNTHRKTADHPVGDVATIEDGKLYARGAANSKGDLVARLAAVEAYQKTFGKLLVTLRFIVEGEDGLGPGGPL